MSQRSQRETHSPDGGVLYVIATPIGNLGDVSSRALDTLRSVGLVLCEDTRRTRKLLTHHGIETGTASFHEHNEQKKVPAILEQLNAGARIALVSDAGTPTISDPGYRLINALAGTEIPVIPIPGPSAVTALLSVSGLPTDRFVFEGFLPVKSGKRRRHLEELAVEPRTIVLFESPFRIARTLAECSEILGDRRCCFGRELTKHFEEIRHGSLAELSAWAEGRKFKGEIVIAIAGLKPQKRS
jgi:16S rRNA (cytidine1402-2'-O)-methyltransferase